LGLVTLVVGAAVGNVSPFRMLSSLSFTLVDSSFESHNPDGLFYIVMALARVLWEVPVLNANLQDQTLTEGSPPPPEHCEPVNDGDLTRCSGNINKLRGGDKLNLTSWGYIPVSSVNISTYSIYL
jgi:hypothetical protein